MIKNISKFALAILLAAAVPGMTATVSAQTNTPAPKTPRARPIPFTGKLGSVDKVNKTITLAEKTQPGRIFQVTSETKIMKNGKPATLDDGVVGEAVAGQYTTGADGKPAATSIRFGDKPNPAKSTGTPPKDGGSPQ